MFNNIFSWIILIPLIPMVYIAVKMLAVSIKAENRDKDYGGISLGQIAAFTVLLSVCIAIANVKVIIDLHQRPDYDVFWVVMIALMGAYPIFYFVFRYISIQFHNKKVARSNSIATIDYLKDIEVMVLLRFIALTLMCGALINIIYQVKAL